jgi:multidrug efflux pump subunit AcrA (membrane-fusion protein)
MRAHAELARRQGLYSICTVPLLASGKPVGAITLERESDRPFDAVALDLCRDIAELIGPILDLRRREERPLAAKTMERLRTSLIHLFGPGHLRLKTLVLSTAALAVLLTLAKGEYRVTAHSVIEGAFQMAVVAPQAGYIAEARMRAGDLVRVGDILASLDARDLVLERQKWHSEREKHVKEYYEALARGERTRVSILRARTDQSEAQVRLIDEQISRVRLCAPVDGVLVSGDLSQSIGAPVERGQVLFEVAPLDAYRVVLKVDEHDVAAVEAGQRGRLVLAALPDRPLAMTVEKVTPVAVADTGRNYFRVEARLDAPPPELRPGMQGIAKVKIDRRPLLWIWTHALVDRLRLWAWLFGV